MKLEFHGHDERYVVEQSLMNLFPGELPVYEPIAPGDGAWAKITCDEAGDYLVVTTDLFFHGQSGVYTYGAPLSGTDFDREGQRRHAVGACFYLARREMGLPDLPWGMLTGVRPDKPVTCRLRGGSGRGGAGGAGHRRIRGHPLLSHPLRLLLLREPVGGKEFFPGAALCGRPGG